jgi:dUTP pyrophosphatase
MLEVKIKKLHPDSVIPSYAKYGDAGLDLTAVSKSYDEYGNTVFGTGLAFEIPEGYVGLLFPRSSNAKTDLRLTNSVGVLDSSYRGEVMFKYRNDNYATIKKEKEFLFEIGVVRFANEYEIGDRIGQLIIIPYPQVKLIEAEELSTTERGEGSYGSTGK